VLFKMHKTHFNLHCNTLHHIATYTAAGVCLSKGSCILHGGGIESNLTLLKRFPLHDLSSGKLCRID